MNYSSVQNTDDTMCKHKTHLTLYSIFHVIIALFAIYLSWKCNQQHFNLGAFVIALFCPYLYIIWALATRGGCGTF